MKLNKLHIKKSNYKGAMVLFLFLHLCYLSNSQSFELKLHPESFFSENKFTDYNVKFRFPDTVHVFNEIEKIHNELLSKSYLSASVDSVCFDALKVNAYFYIGKPFSVNEFKFSDTENMLIKRQKISEKHLKRKTSITKLSDTYNKIIKNYENNGYPFACIKPELTELSDSSFSLKLSVNENSKVYIGDIYIKGEAGISNNYIKNFLSINEKDIYNQSVINQMYPKINNLNFVSHIKAPEIEFIGNKADIYLYLKKEKADLFSGIIGFITNKENENKLLITGDLNLSLINNFKIGEELSLNWLKTAKESQKLLFDFKIPYVLKTAVGFNTKLNLDKKDSSYLSFSGTVGIDYAFKNNDKMSVYYKKINSFILNSELIDTSLFKNVKSNLYGFLYKINTTDNFINPLNGYYFETDISNGNRIVNSQKYSFISICSTIEFYKRLINKLIIKAVSVNRYMFSNSMLYQNELFRVGGIRTIRGFEEEAFYTQKYTMIGAEIRYVYEKQSNIYSFIDIARIYEQNGYKYLTGFGLGANIGTKAGIFSIAFALGTEYENPLNLSEIKVHVGYLNRF